MKNWYSKYLENPGAWLDFLDYLCESLSKDAAQEVRHAFLKLFPLAKEVYRVPTNPKTFKDKGESL